MTAGLPLFIAMAAGVCLPVRGDRIRAGDLAAADPVFAALPADMAVGYGPAPGARRWFRTPELARLARRYGLGTPSAPAVCFELTMVPLDPARLAEAMKRSLPAEARLEVVDYSRHPVPAGEIDFQTAGLSPRPDAGGLALWRGFVRYGDQRRFRIWARVRVAVPVRRVVADRDLPPGRPIEAGDLRVDSVEVFPAAGGMVASIEDAVGRMPRRTVKAGEPLLSRVLDSPPMVAAGDAVRVEASAGAARVELAALAESPGRRGDVIVVRNTANHRRFRARIEGPGRATPAVAPANSKEDNGR